MDKNKIIKQVEEYIKKEFAGDSSGHDWWHIYRVWKMAKEIAEKEGGDMFVIELGALLHDIGDWKFNDDLKAGSKKAKELLKSLNVDELTINHVCDIVNNVSFKGAGVKNGIKTLEGEIVQDADRLDAIGAIGIARTFIYAGHAGKGLYNPDKKIENFKTLEDYKNRQGYGLNHFYEKSLLLKDRLNTKTAKKIAEPRHKFLKTYLKQFLKEWSIKI